ncbi:hypothetical protein ACHAWF_006275, partial [Thalassiosira exigua]
PNLCDGASGRNSGVICTGVDAPRGSLERALIRDSISNVRGFCEEHNVPTRECGSLVCAWPWDDDDSGDGGGEGEEGGDEKKIDDGRDDVGSGGREESRDSNRVAAAKLERVLAESRDAGDAAARLSPAEVAKLEPSLSSECRGAVRIEGEIVVDPWLFCLALAAHCRELAAEAGGGEGGEEEGDVLRLGREALLDRSSFDAAAGVWSVATRGTRNGDGGQGDDDDDVDVIRARCVINAAGIDADLVQSRASSAEQCALPPPDFEARPRRGQYLVFAGPNLGDDVEDARREANARIPARPIQPVPTRFTKGIFVYSTLYDQLVVGPTALDQTSRTDDVPDPAVARELASHASRVLGPGFEGLEVVGEYVGIRPGTSKSDYRIEVHPESKFITLGGIRSTGLTASLGIGWHVARSLLPAAVPPPPNDRSGPLEQLARPTPLPDARELAEQFRRRGDGTVEVGGHVYKVTHPLTRMGWAAGTGLASRRT